MHYPFIGYTILLGQKVELGQKVAALVKKSSCACGSSTLYLGHC